MKVHPIQEFIPTLVSIKWALVIVCFAWTGFGFGNPLGTNGTNGSEYKEPENPLCFETPDFDAFMKKFPEENSYLPADLWPELLAAEVKLEKERGRLKQKVRAALSGKLTSEQKASLKFLGLHIVRSDSCYQDTSDMFSVSKECIDSIVNFLGPEVNGIRRINKTRIELADKIPSLRGPLQNYDLKIMDELLEQLQDEMVSMKTNLESDSRKFFEDLALGMTEINDNDRRKILEKVRSFKISDWSGVSRDLARGLCPPVSNGNAANFTSNRLIVFCPQQVLESNAVSRTLILGHEVAHFFDPEEWEREQTADPNNPARDAKPPFHSLLSCLGSKEGLDKRKSPLILDQNKRPISTPSGKLNHGFFSFKHTQIGEALSDRLGIEYFLHRLFKYEVSPGSRKKKLEQMIVTLLKNFDERDDSKFWVHPNWLSRISRVFLSHPKVRATLGCRQIESPHYCPLPLKNQNILDFEANSTLEDSKTKPQVDSSPQATGEKNPEVLIDASAPRQSTPRAKNPGVN